MFLQGGAGGKLARRDKHKHLNSAIKSFVPMVAGAVARAKPAVITHAMGVANGVDADVKLQDKSRARAGTRFAPPAGVALARAVAAVAPMAVAPSVAYVVLATRALVLAEVAVCAEVAHAFAVTLETIVAVSVRLHALLAGLVARL